MEILRVETYASGKGPYHTSAIPLDKFGTDEKHPHPSEDHLLDWESIASREWFFGFKDMKHLLEWFPKTEWKMFYQYNQSRKDPDHHIGISTFIVPDLYVVHGEKQSVFRIDYAERIDFKPFRRAPNIAERIINAMVSQ